MQTLLDSPQRSGHDNAGARFVQPSVTCSATASMSVDRLLASADFSRLLTPASTFAAALLTAGPAGAGAAVPPDDAVITAADPIDIDPNDDAFTSSAPPLPPRGGRRSLAAD